MTFSKELLFIHHGLFEASEYIFPQGAYDAAFQMSSFICSRHIEFNLQHGLN